MIANNHSLLPVIRVAEIVTEDDSPRWLIDQLWGAAAVGVIGGAAEMFQDLVGAGYVAQRCHRHGMLGSL